MKITAVIDKPREQFVGRTCHFHILFEFLSTSVPKAIFKMMVNMARAACPIKNDKMLKQCRGSNP